MEDSCSNKAEPPSSLSSSLSLSDIVRIGTVAEWQTRNHSHLPLLDLRSDEEYRQCHIQGSVHIPLSEVKQRSYELPPRHDAFVVLVPSLSENEDKEALLTSLIGDYFLGLDQRKRAQKPWNIPLLLLSGDEQNWEQAKALGIFIGVDEGGENDQHKPQPRLWQPDPMVRDVLLPLLKQQLSSSSSSSSCSPTRRCHEIWDLGAGAGRDVCFLAEELQLALQQTCSTPMNNNNHNNNNNKSFCVVGMDQRYKAKYIATKEEECLQFWKRRSVQDVTRCVSVQWDNAKNDSQDREQQLRQWFLEQQQQQQQQQRVLTCLYAVRFWNASLFQFIATASAQDETTTASIIPEGTLVAISQFTKPYPGAPWDFEHPKEKNVLERNQLSQLFSDDAGWKILHDAIVPDSDHGRTLIQFVAQKV